MRNCGNNKVGQTNIMLSLGGIKLRSLNENLEVS